MVLQPSSAPCPSNSDPSQSHPKCPHAQGWGGVLIMLWASMHVPHPQFSPQNLPPMTAAPGLAPQASETQSSRSNVISLPDPPGRSSHVPADRKQKALSVERPGWPTSELLPRTAQMVLQS